MGQPNSPRHDVGKLPTTEPNDVMAARARPLIKELLYVAVGGRQF
ncbi:hypothetical protein ACAX43_19265 [Paraburkholderia sp. IW21]